MRSVLFMLQDKRSLSPSLFSQSLPGPPWRRRNGEIAADRAPLRIRGVKIPAGKDSGGSSPLVRGQPCPECRAPTPRRQSRRSWAADVSTGSRRLRTPFSMMVPRCCRTAAPGARVPPAPRPRVTKVPSSPPSPRGQQEPSSPSSLRWAGRGVSASHSE